MLTQSFLMQCRSISFVPRETVVRINFVIFLHHPVARNFCHDAGGGDRGAFGVASDHRLLGPVNLRYLQAVDQDEIGNERRMHGQEILQRASNRVMAGLEDIDRINELVIRLSQCPPGFVLQFLE